MILILFLFIFIGSIGVSIYLLTKKYKQIKKRNKKINKEIKVRTKCKELQYYDKKTKRCKNLDNKKIKEKCIKDNLVYKDGACLKKQTKESCNNIQSGNDPKFKKELKNDLCEDISIEKKKSICAKFNHVYDEKNDKCICGPGTSYSFGQCVGQLTEEICFNKNAFTKPNKRTDLTSCIPMSESEKKKYCTDKGLKYSFKFQSCIKEVTPEYCKSLSVPDELFKKVPDEFNEKKSCRNLLPYEKGIICRQNNLTRFWDGTNCLKKLSKPTIELIGQPDISSVSLKITYNDFINQNLKPISIDYLIYDISKSMPKIYYNENQFEIIQNVDKVIKIKILNLKHNNKYKIKFKLLTSTPNFESPFSDFLEFTTKCNPAIFTESFCKNNYGPEGNTIVPEQRKDPEVIKWPYFKVPNKDTNCGCTEMSIDQAKKYCKDTFYQTLNGDVLINDNNCIPAPTTTGPCLNLTIKNLNINQDNNGDDIESATDYLVNEPFRILIEWRRPNLDKFNTENLNDVYPNEYLIYRKKIECNYSDQASCIADNNCLFSESSCSVKGIVASNTCEQFTNINSQTNDYTLISTINVTDQNKINFKYTDSNNLISNTKYSYRIDPVNSVGVGKSIEISIISANTRKTESECKTQYSDGFKKTYDILKNCCVDSSVSERTAVCQSRPKVNSDYENTYNDDIKDCEPLINFVVPGKPTLEYVEKTKNEITLKIIPPSQVGTPSLDRYLLTWVASYENKGKLSHGSSYSTSQKNYADNTAFISTNWIFPDNKSLSNEFKITHRYLDPATTYSYQIASFSLNDLWKNDYDTDREGMIYDKKRIGRSDFNSLFITTDYSFPLEAPTLEKIGEATNNEIKLKINKFPKNKEGGSANYPAFITHYKIVKYIIPHKPLGESTYFESNEPSGTEIIIDLNKLNQFNNDWADSSKDNNSLDSSNILNINDQSSDSTTTDSTTTPPPIGVTEQSSNLIYSTQNYKIQKNIKDNNYYFTDNNIEPSTTYKYKIYAKNNQIDQYSNDFKDINLTTPVLNPIYVCDIASNVSISKDFSTTSVNKVDLRISWDHVTDPNISNYSTWPNMYQQKPNYPKYEIYLDDSLKKTIKTNSTRINNVEINRTGTNKIKLNIKTIIKGTLTRNNGFTTTITSTSIFEKRIETLSITQDSDCDKSSIYRDNTIITGSDVPFYFDTTNQVCKTRENNIIKMNEYCQSLEDPKVYFHEQGQCITPNDGVWTPASNINPQCTSDGLPGDDIICGTGKRIINKYTYTVPDTSNFLITAGLEHLNGIPANPPTGSTVDTNDQNVAYEFGDCNPNSCSTLCDSNFGSLTDNALKSNGTEKPLTATQLNDSNYCLTDTLQPFIITNPTESCPSCGDPTTTVTKYTGCLNGFAGNQNLTNCETYITSTLKKDLITSTISSDNNFEKNKWYKCKYTVNSSNEYTKLANYPNICDPPVEITQSNRKDSKGNNINIVREKYFKKTEEDCSISYCNWVPTTDRFTTSTNYCGTQTISSSKRCSRDNNYVTNNNCGPVCSSGDINCFDTYPYTEENYALTQDIVREDCKEMCEKNNDAYFNSNSISSQPQTETNFKTLCEDRNTIDAKLTTKISKPCDQCSTKSDKKEITYSCTDGAYGSDADTKCLTKYPGYFDSESGTTQIEKNKNRAVNVNVYTATEEIPCENKNCGPNYSAWGECDKHCGGGTQTRTYTCEDKDGNTVDDDNCTNLTPAPVTSQSCNTRECKTLCESTPNYYLKDSELDPTLTESFTNQYTTAQILQGIKTNADIVITYLETALEENKFNECVKEVDDNLKLTKTEFDKRCITKTKFKKLCDAKNR